MTGANGRRGSGNTASSRNVSERIDSHHHLWRLSRGDYDWMGPETTRIQRDFGPVDLEPLLRAHGIGRTVVVQAAATEAESRFLLEIADEASFIAGVVIWLDMERDDFADRLAVFREDRRVVGVRAVIHDIADPRWMLRPAVRRAFAELSRRSVCFDFLTRPEHLPHVVATVRDFPELRCVIDHISKPDIAAGQLSGWRSLMRELAEHPRVHVKLSGMVTEARWKQWRPEQFSPYVDEMLEAFGPRRLMFGSDWPVCLLSASYAEVVELCEEQIARLSDDEQAEIFGGTARRFYGLPDA